MGYIRSVIACLVIGMAAGPALASEIAGTASVIDGDTIEIHGQKIRMAGIDAPESRQLCQDPAGKQYRCGQKAALYLDGLIGGKTVTAHCKAHDRYKRQICRIDRQGQDINATMVSAGWAVAYRKYSKAYIPAEEAAHGLRAGIWAGSFEMPWRWRKHK